MSRSPPSMRVSSAGGNTSAYAATQMGKLQQSIRQSSKQIVSLLSPGLLSLGTPSSTGNPPGVGGNVDIKA